MQPSDSLQRASTPHPARHTHANSGSNTFPRTAHTPLSGNIPRRKRGKGTTVEPGGWSAVQRTCNAWGDERGSAEFQAQASPRALKAQNRCCSSPENPGCAPWSGPPTQLKLPTRVHMHTCSAATTPHPASHPRPRCQRAAALPALQLPKVPDLQDEARGIAPAPV